MNINIQFRNRIQLCKIRIKITDHKTGIEKRYYKHRGNGNGHSGNIDWEHFAT